MRNDILLRIKNIIPELIAILLIAFLGIKSLEVPLFFFLIGLALRTIWNSTIIVHGAGHVLITAIIDKNLSFINLTNILENQKPSDILKSLIFFNPIYIPFFKNESYPAIAVGNSATEYIRIKALGGILFNLIASAIAIIFLDRNIYSFFPIIFIGANLLIAFSSLSDLSAFITGVADCFNCGNFGFLAKRNALDDNELLPKRFVTIYQKMGRETEVRGEQAGGGLVFARDKNNQVILVGKKIVNNKRDNLTKSLETAFAPVRRKAVTEGAKPLESTVTGVWHYRYGTSSAPSIREHDLEGYAIAATKNQVFEAILIMMLRSLQAISRAFFMINLPSRVPNLSPLGMTLTQASLRKLEFIKDDFLYQNILTITGTTSRGEVIHSAEQQKLVTLGRQWALHVTETPLVWLIHALYVLITVGWAIPFGQTIPLAKTLFHLMLSIAGWQNHSFFLTLVAPLVTLADIAIYVFGPLLWTLGLRYIQGRQLLARMGKRTLVVGDLPWVHQLLKSYVSKLFSLSYGIASLEIHGANPQDQMLHHFGHRVVRGTLIYLGVPDGRRGKIQKQEESATIMTGKQANGIRNLGAGPEIVAVGHNPAIARQDFCEIFSRLFVKSLFLGGKR